MLCEQVRQAKKAEVQGQKKAEKAAREAAEREKDLRSYKHIMQVPLCAFATCATSLFRRICPEQLSLQAVWNEGKLSPEAYGCMQEDAMVSSKEVAEKYNSFKDYEDDFM